MKYCIYCMKEKDDKTDVCPHCGKNQSDYVIQQHILRPGTVLDNRYTVGAVIGEGGFGITYIGYDDRLGYRVAIKELYPNAMVNRSVNLSNDVNSIRSEEVLFNKCRTNFHNEAVTLARYDSEPGIVSVKDCFSENNTEYIIMEYLDGITLKNYVNRVGRISYDNLLCLMFPVMQSLRKIHNEGIIHRDISPDNIMLVGEMVKLIDFGSAREYTNERTMSMMIKHGYAPMEQYDSTPGKQGAWTDVYALCATMYYCLIGKVPPQATNRIPQDSIELISENGVNIAPEYEAAIMHGLEVMPSGRIKSIDELMNLLRYGDPAYAAEMKTRILAGREKDPVDTVDIPTEYSDDTERNKTDNANDNNKNDKKKTMKLAAAVCAGVFILGGGVFAAVRMSGRETAPAVSTDTSAAVSEKTTTAAVTTENKVLSTAPQTTTTVQTTTTAATEITTIRHEPITVNFEKKKYSLYAGDTQKIKYNLSEDSGLTWSSSDSSVVSVNNGTITAESGGTATITAETPDGNSASCKIEVKTPSVKLSSKYEELYFGDSIYLNYELDPGNQNVVLSSSDNSIVRTDGNTVTAMGTEGECIVTATLLYGEKSYKDSMTIKVSNISIDIKQPVTNVYKEALADRIEYDQATGQFDYYWGYPAWKLYGANNEDISWKVVTGSGYMDGANLHITRPGSVRVRGTISRNGYTAFAEYTVNMTLKWTVNYTTGRDGILKASPGGSEICKVPAGTYMEFTDTSSVVEDGKYKLYGRTSYDGRDGWIVFGEWL